MELNVTVTGDTTRIRVAGAIDERGAEQLKAAFTGLHLDGQRAVAFDFAGVSHIGSAGLGKLLLIYQRVASKGLSMSVENLSTGLRELFAELRLDGLFRVN